MVLPNGSRLSCGRLARRRKAVGRQSVPRQGHNIPLPLERSPPASFKRLLGCRTWARTMSGFEHAVPARTDASHRGAEEDSTHLHAPEASAKESERGPKGRWVPGHQRRQDSGEHEHSSDHETAAEHAGDAPHQRRDCTTTIVEPHTRLVAA